MGDFTPTNGDRESKSQAKLLTGHFNSIQVQKNLDILLIEIITIIITTRLRVSINAEPVVSKTLPARDRENHIQEDFQGRDNQKRE